MDPTAKETALKKKLQQFLLEMFRMGTVKGFLHFSMYLRGKEEMGLTVHHEPQMVSSRRCSILHSTAPEVSAGESLTSARLPYDPSALVLSQRTQLSLSGMKDRGVGLPPASPSDNEQGPVSESNTTLFLIAGYARYSCPYVWVRSNHRRLMRLSGADQDERDNPLRLKSAAKWKDGDTHIWDVVAELVKLCMYPHPRNPFAVECGSVLSTLTDFTDTHIWDVVAELVKLYTHIWDVVAELVKLCMYPHPRNPFEVDLQYLQTLPPHQTLLTTAAMMVCLQKIALHTADDRPYTDKVLEDLQQVSRLHYTALQSLVSSQQMPIYQHCQQRQKQAAKAKRGGFAVSRHVQSSVDNPLLSQPPPPPPMQDSYGGGGGGGGGGGMTVQSTQGVYTPQGSAESGFPGYGFTPAPTLF